MVVYNSVGMPQSRTITINGITQDLSSNQTWSVGVGITNGASSPAPANLSIACFEYEIQGSDVIAGNCNLAVSSYMGDIGTDNLFSWSYVYVVNYGSPNFGSVFWADTNYTNSSGGTFTGSSTSGLNLTLNLGQYSAAGDKIKVTLIYTPN